MIRTSGSISTPPSTQRRIPTGLPRTSHGTRAFRDSTAPFLCPNFSDPQLGSFLNVLEFVAAPDSPGPNGILCDGGDSGAAMVSRSRDSFGAIVGILFAASVDGMRGLVVPFEYIQKRFGVNVA